RQARFQCGILWRGSGWDTNAKPDVPHHLFGYGFRKSTLECLQVRPPMGKDESDGGVSKQYDPKRYQTVVSHGIFRSVVPDSAREALDKTRKTLIYPNALFRMKTSTCLHCARALTVFG